MQLVSGPVVSPDAGLPEVTLSVERINLAKRLWRGTAADGAEFGFELAAPLRPGDVFWQTAAARYVIVQQPEPVLEISLEVAPPRPPGSGGRSATCTSNSPPNRSACWHRMSRRCVSCWIV